MLANWRHKRKLKKFAGTIVTTFGRKAENELVLIDEAQSRLGRCVSRTVPVCDDCGFRFGDKPDLKQRACSHDNFTFDWKAA
jgi:predicted Zn-ribbon and HTH transcriptional regulator